MEINDTLDERKEVILKAIISNYLETGEPVGSRTISKYTDLNLSSATIRNEMSDLEELGYIVQPHTSAGRVPTDKGYRFYVDRMMAEKEESEAAQGTLLERVDKLEALLKQVAKVLAFNTQYATMVTSPRMLNKRIKFIQLSQVDEKDLVAVIVVGDNVARNQIIHVDRQLSNEDVLKFNLLLNTFLQGAMVTEINIELMQTMKRQAGEGEYADILEAIFEGIVDAVHQAEETHIYTSGASNILKYNELGDINKATALLETFEEQTGLSELADEYADDGANSTAAYPSLYRTPSASGECPQQCRDLSSDGAECQSREERERNTILSTNVGVQLDWNKDGDVSERYVQN